MRRRRFPVSAGNWENRGDTWPENDYHIYDPHPRRNSRQEKPLPGTHTFSPGPPASDTLLCMARTTSPRNSPPRACLYISPPVSDNPPNRSTEARQFLMPRRVLHSVQVAAQPDAHVTRAVRSKTRVSKTKNHRRGTSFSFKRYRLIRCHAFILSVRLARFNVLFCSQDRISRLRHILVPKLYPRQSKIDTIGVHPFTRP